MSTSPKSSEGKAKSKPKSEADKDVLRGRLMLASAAKLKKQILAARESPAAFMEFALRTPKGTRIKLTPFHQEWFSHIDKHRRVQIEASKSHGKTSVLLAYILWSVGRNPNIRIKLFAQSEEKARERLSTIADLLLNNKLVRLVFPDMRPAVKGVWHKHAIQVERSISDKEPTIEASGIMGSVEGGRADMVVLDDISDFRTSLVYPQFRESIKKKVYAEILPMLEEDGRAISIATPHHAADVVSSLRANNEWKSFIYAVGSPGDPFLPLWPERWPREALQRLYNEIGPLEYDRAYRCIAFSSEMQIVKPEHIKYYDAEMMPDPWRLLCVQAYDLAITEAKKASYFACVTFLYDQEKNIVFVADAWHTRVGFTEQAQLLVNEARKWQPDRIVVEETGYQKALREYLMEIAKEPLPIFPCKPGNKSKELRLMETLPMFEAGKIYFNPRLDSQIHLEVSGRGDLITQLLTFTQTADKDLGDAFAYGVRALRAFRDEEADDDWDNGDGVSARMSIIGA